MHPNPYTATNILLEFVLCWSFYVAGVAMPAVGTLSFLQGLSFLVSTLVGLATLLKLFGVDINIMKRFKKKHKKH